METNRKDVYLTCTRRKGHPKKHVSVCRRCRWNRSCVVFRRYAQPELPLMPPADEPADPPPLPFTIVEAPPPPQGHQQLLTEIRETLLEIRDLCAGGRG